MVVAKCLTLNYAPLLLYPTLVDCEETTAMWISYVSCREMYSANKDAKEDGIKASISVVEMQRCINPRRRWPLPPRNVLTKLISHSWYAYISRQGSYDGNTCIYLPQVSSWIHAESSWGRRAMLIQVTRGTTTLRLDQRVPCTS